MTVYVEREGRGFGFEDRAKLVRLSANGETRVLYEPPSGSIFAFPVLRCRLWALLNGCGWVPSI